MSRNIEYDNAIKRLSNSILALDETNAHTSHLTEYQQYGLKIVQDMHDLFVAKDKDYAANKPMGNLRSSEEIGIDPWRACVLRMCDKMARIKSFTTQKAFNVSDEKITDTLLDLANYSLFGDVLRGEIYDKTSHFDDVALKAIKCKIAHDFQYSDVTWDDVLYQELEESFNLLKIMTKNSF